MSDTYRILVVEDDEQIRDGIEIYLKSQGYEVSKAGEWMEYIWLCVFERNTIFR